MWHIIHAGLPWVQNKIPFIQETEQTHNHKARNPELFCLHCSYHHLKICPVLRSYSISTSRFWLCLLTMCSSCVLGWTLEPRMVLPTKQVSLSMINVMAKLFLFSRYTWHFTSTPHFKSVHFLAVFGSRCKVYSGRADKKKHPSKTETFFLCSQK